jgi:hypothetical protein
MNRVRTALSLVLVSAAISCASHRAKPAETSGPVEKPSTGTAVEPAPDLSPVVTPAGLFAVGRWRRPSETIDTLLGWVNLPIPWRSLLTREGEGIGAVVAVDAPVELAVVVPQSTDLRQLEPRKVFSIGVTSVAATVDFARRQGENVERLAPGVFRVGSQGKVECAVANAVGSAPGRLVCSDDFEDVEELLAYATRGLPLEELGKGDMHVELRMEPLRPLARELRQKGLALALNQLTTNDSRLDRAMAEAVRGTVDELAVVVEDADRISLDVQLDGPGGTATTSLASKFRDQKSWTVQTLLDAHSHSAAAPEQFWRLPSDASSAGYSTWVTPNRFDWGRRTLTDILDASLARANVSTRLREQVRRAMDEVPFPKGPSVQARGALPPAADATRDQKRARKFIGWSVMGLESEPAEKLTAYLDRLLAIYTDRELRKLMTSSVNAFELLELPTVTSRAANGLGRGAKLYTVNVRSPEAGGARAKAKVGDRVTLTIAVVPDGKGSFLGWSVDEKYLLDKLRLVQKPGASATLATRPGLEELRDKSRMGAGFTTLRGLSQMVPGRVSGGRELDTALETAPNRGNTPILSSVELKRGTQLELVWALRAPKPAISDVAAVASRVIGQGLLGAGGEDED